MIAEKYLILFMVLATIIIPISILMCKTTKNHVKQEYKQSKVRKIPVGLVYDDIDAAKRMLCKLEPQPFDMIVRQPGLVETRSLMIHLIKEGDYFHGCRLSFVYTTKEIADSEWFRTVVRPMMTCGIGELCD